MSAPELQGPQGTVCRKALWATVLIVLLFCPLASASTLATVVYTRNEPWAMTQKGTPAGVSIDILKEAASRADITLNFLEAPAREKQRLLAQGNADLTVNVREGDKILRTCETITPAYLTGRRFVIYSLRNSVGNYPRYEKLRWHYVGIVRGKTYFEPFYSDRSIAKKRFRTLSDAFYRLMSHNVHAVAASECAGGYWLSQHQDLSRHISRTPIAFDEYRPMYIGLSKKSPNRKELQTQLSQALISMLQDGSMKSIRSRYHMGF